MTLFRASGVYRLSFKTAQLHPANLPSPHITLLLKVKDVALANILKSPFFVFLSHIWFLMCIHSCQNLLSFTCRQDSVLLRSLTKGLPLTCSTGHGGPVLDQHPLSSLHHGSLLHVDRTGRHRTQNSVKASKAVIISLNSFCCCSCRCNDKMYYIRGGHKTLANSTTQNQHGTLIQSVWSIHW